MSKYKQLNADSKKYQDLLTTLHNKMVDTLNDENDASIILVTHALSKPRVTTNVTPKENVPSTLSEVALGMSNALKQNKE